MPEVDNSSLSMEIDSTLDCPGRLDNLTPNVLTTLRRDEMAPRRSATNTTVILWPSYRLIPHLAEALQTILPPGHLPGMVTGANERSGRDLLEADMPGRRAQ